MVTEEQKQDRLSSLRVLYNGAEPIRGGTLTARRCVQPVWVQKSDVLSLLRHGRDNVVRDRRPHLQNPSEHGLARLPSKPVGLSDQLRTMLGPNANRMWVPAAGVDVRVSRLSRSDRSADGQLAGVDQVGICRCWVLERTEKLERHFPIDWRNQ